MNFRYSLSGKTLTRILLVVVIILGAATYWQWGKQYRTLIRKLHEENIHVSQALDASFHDSMLKADSSSLQNMVRKVGQIESMKRVYVLSARRTVYLSSSGDLKTAPPPPKEEVGNGFQELQRTADGSVFMHALQPISAAQECLSCHENVRVGQPIGFIGLERFAQTDFEELAADRVQLLVTNTFLILVLAGAIFLVTRSVVNPIKTMAGVSRRIAVGDISAEVSYRSSDEIGDLAQSFREMMVFIRDVSRAVEALGNGDLSWEIVPRSSQDVLSRDVAKTGETLRRLVAQTVRLIQAAEKGRLSERGDPGAFQGVYADVIHGMNEMQDKMIAPLREAARVLQAMASRDLTVVIQGHYEGEFDSFTRAVNTATDNLRKTLELVADSSSELAQSAVNITDGSQALAASANRQASALEEISSSLQEIAGMALHNTESARQANLLTGSAEKSAKVGAESMNRLAEAIERIQSTASQTGKIVKTINEIAFQTNLLALNAAIEAARAGDAGRGFAVVAEEVRSLALRSAAAAKTTAELIEQSVKSAESAFALRQEVLDDLEQINGQVRSISQVMQDITAASEQQTQGLDQITRGVESMNQVTQQTATTSEESAAAAVQLSEQARILKDLTNAFRLRLPEPALRPELTT
ncbi:MAG: methyl-accepting chemotaxis protein [Acidobacteriota bacterium]